MNVQSADDPTCPFCPFFDPDSNLVAQHVQYCHPEIELQTASKQSNRTKSSGNLEVRLSACSEKGSGSSHGSLSCLGHVSDTLNPRESTASGHSSFSLSQSQEENARNSSGGLLCSQSDDQVEQRMKAGNSSNKYIKKLGRAELGPYAHEKKMPSWLFRMLHKGNATSNVIRIAHDGRLSRHVVIENETPNVVPALAQLCGQDTSIQRAFLCSAHVHHISEIPKQGGFCGYRNIQMLVSYIQESRGPGCHHFPGALPTILQLQDIIERAWDMGYNTVGRTETGGIKGTRKYIGTSEAQALFLSLGIQCEARSIGKTKDMPAHSSLLSHVAAYFRGASPLDKKTEKVVLTDLPPIYLQHHGHSMTIVGIEVREQGSANILVFDPSFKTPSLIKHAMGVNIMTSDPARVLKGYRKGVDYLQKYQAFELLELLPPRFQTEN